MFSKWFKNLAIFYLIIISTSIKGETIIYRLSAKEDSTRIVFETKQKPLLKQISLQHWQLTFPETVNISQQPPKIAPHSLLKNLHFNAKICDLEFQTPIELRSFYLTDPDRLVLDITKSDSLGTLIAEQIYKNQFDNPRKQNVVLELNQPPKAKKFTVVLDPGHGGKDSGAVGVRGTLEKNLNLIIAQKIAFYLKKERHLEVFLTREQDFFIALRQRLQIARKHQADLFISIHADAHWNRQAQGASIFALSPKGATSETARWIAKKENESELGRELQDKDLIVKTVLLDLAQTATIKNSLMIGNYLLRNLKKITPLHSQIVEQAAFLVLKAPEIPSLLIETGFISNQQEEKKLLDKNYQNQIAFQIAQGILQYVNNNPQ